MKELRELLDRRDAADGELSPIAGTFLRGLSLGALVGAAIAGSAIWRRYRGPHEAPHDADRPDVDRPDVDRPDDARARRRDPA